MSACRSPQLTWCLLQTYCCRFTDIFCGRYLPEVTSIPFFFHLASLNSSELMTRHVFWKVSPTSTSSEDGETATPSMSAVERLCLENINELPNIALLTDSFDVGCCHDGNSRVTGRRLSYEQLLIGHDVTGVGSLDELPGIAWSHLRRTQCWAYDGWPEIL